MLRARHDQALQIQSHNQPSESSPPSSCHDCPRCNEWAERYWIGSIEKKLDRLTAAYLDAGAFSAAEFRKRKEETLGKKRLLLDSIATLDQSENQRFEPIIRFLNGSKQMKYVAERKNPKELRATLEDIGSNLTVRDRRLHWEPRGAWKLVVDCGSFAQPVTAPAIAGAAAVGETHQTSIKWRRRELKAKNGRFRYRQYGLKGN